MTETGFYLLSIFMLLLPVVVIRRLNGLDDIIRKRIISTYGICMIGWLGYTTLMILTGVLDDFGMPPRIPLLLVVPAIAFSILLLNRKTSKKMLRATPLYLPIYIQSFRIVVELLIYGAFLEEVFPVVVTFEGYNMDVFVGLSAPVIGLLHHRKILGRRSLLLWNTLALVVLTVTMGCFMYAFLLARDILPVHALDFTAYPYVLLPSILLPFALFYHIFSIKQLLLVNKKY